VKAVVFMPYSFRWLYLTLLAPHILDPEKGPILRDGRVLHPVGVLELRELFRDLQTVCCHVNGVITRGMVVQGGKTMTEKEPHGFQIALS